MLSAEFLENLRAKSFLVTFLVCYYGFMYRPFLMYLPTLGECLFTVLWLAASLRKCYKQNFFQPGLEMQKKKKKKNRVSFLQWTVINVHPPSTSQKRSIYPHHPCKANKKVGLNRTHSQPAKKYCTCPYLPDSIEEWTYLFTFTQRRPH